MVKAKDIIVCNIHIYNWTKYFYKVFLTTLQYPSCFKFLMSIVYLLLTSILLSTAFVKTFIEVPVRGY